MLLWGPELTFVPPVVETLLQLTLSGLFFSANCHPLQGSEEGDVCYQLKACSPDLCSERWSYPASQDRARSVAGSQETLLVRRT